MPFLSGRTVRVARPLSVVSTSASRPLSTTIRRGTLSESDHTTGHDVDQRKAAIDEHKHDQLNKQKAGEGHWKRELSSNSESAIKADRGEVDDEGKDIEELQKRTTEAMNQK